MLNRSSKKSFQGKMPYKMQSGKIPKLSHLRIFGSIVHVKTTGKLSKLDDRSKEKMLVGYKRCTKGYKCFDPTTHKIHLSHDMIFEENLKWNFNEGQACEGMLFKELHVSSVDLELESLRER